MAVIPLVTGLICLTGCHRSAEDCASRAELTARIAGQTYVFPATDKPNASAQRKDDLFWIWPGDRSNNDLMACQRKEKNPVDLKDLTIEPVSLKPDVVQFSIDNIQLENRVLPSMAEALAEPWVGERRTRSPDSIELRTEKGRQLVGNSCSPKDSKDVSGNPIPVMCDIRVRLEPHGALRLQYLQPDEPTDARQILMRVDEYLQSRKAEPPA